MAQRKSVKLSTRPMHASDNVGGGASAVSGNFMPVDTPVTTAGTASRSEPVYGPLAQAVYGTVYALSFGCVFSAMLVSRILPGQEILARGIGDGARAAKRVATSIGKQPRESMQCELSTRGAEETARAA